MKRKILISVFSIFSFLLVYSQENIVIEGKVECYNTLSPLPYVNIYLKNNQTGIITNNNGEYRLYINKKYLPDTLLFSYLGYETEKRLITANKGRVSLDIKLKTQTTELNTVSVSEKKIIPKNILNNTYNYYKKHQPETYKVDYYTRDIIKNNSEFIYSAKAFLQAYTEENFSLWERNKLLNANILYNDSLLFQYTDTPIVLEIPFDVLTYCFSLNKIKNLLKNDSIQIDTVILNSDNKIYVLNIGKALPYDIPKNYDMILNNNLADTLLNRNKTKGEYSESYKLYIENKGDKYLIKKVDRFFWGYTIKKNQILFINVEYYFKTLDNNCVIPTYKNLFMAIEENNICNYYKYNEYVITEIKETNIIDKENYKPIYDVLPIYWFWKEYFIKIQKNFNKYSQQQFNYIKEDTLEQLVKKDLEKVFK